MASKLVKALEPKRHSRHVSLIAIDDSSSGRGELPELGVSISDWGSQVSGGNGNRPTLSSVIGVKIMLSVIDVVLDMSGQIIAVYS